MSVCEASRGFTSGFLFLPYKNTTVKRLEAVRMALTPKQENFCRLIASGKDYVTAYKSSYDWNGSDNGAYNEAMKLANREDIQAKIATLRKPIEIAIQGETITARQKQIDEIQKRIEICKAKEDENSLIRYMDMLNKIYSLYKETETETQNDNKLDNIDSSVLKRLSGVS